MTIVTAAIEEIEKDYTFTSFRVEEVKEAEIIQHDNNTVEPQEISYPEIDINDINTYTVDKELSKRENDGHWVFRSKERDHQTEIQATLQAMNDEVLEVLGNAKDAKYQSAYDRLMAEYVYKLKPEYEKIN